MKITNSLVGQKSQSRVQMLPGLRFLYRAGASKSTPRPPPMLKLGMKQHWKKPKTPGLHFFSLGHESQGKMED